MSSVNQTLRLRAQEIIANSTEPITGRDAMKQALLDRFGENPVAIAEAAAAMLASSLKGLRQRTYELPDDSQGTLLDPPALIGIRDPDGGDVFIHRQQATLGQVRQWIKEGLQHHAAQGMRFARFKEQIQVLEDIDDEAMWVESRELLAARKHLELEAVQ